MGGPSTVMLRDHQHQYPKEFAPTTDGSGRTSPVLSSIHGSGTPRVPISFDQRHLLRNTNIHQSLTWSERMEQAEQLNRERKAQLKILRQIRKQNGVRPKSSRDGLSLGIFGPTDSESIGRSNSTAGFWSGKGSRRPTTHLDDGEEERGRRMPRYHARVGSSHM
jgi:hypothetical protein